MPDPVESLRGENYVNLETFKRNGDGVKTPVWFAHEGDALVFMTNGTSWKCKRLRRNSACKFAACGVAGGIKGPWFDGECVTIDDREQQTSAHRILKKKYGIQWKGLELAAGISGKKKDWAYYRITPGG